jgi:hypothetical protein
MLRSFVFGTALSLIVVCSGFAAQAQSRECLGYHASVGYFDKCTREGRALWLRLRYGGRGAGSCTGYHASVGYFNKCTPEGRRLWLSFQPRY